jgi:hypothetical protein
MRRPDHDVVDGIDELVDATARDHEIIECASGPVRLLDVDDLRRVIDAIAALGFTLRPKYETLEQPTDALIAGENRYVLARGDDIAHASEFGLGDVYLDPLGPQGGHCPAGHHRYVDLALQAMLRTPSVAAVEVPEIGDRLAVSAFRASSPELAAWLGPHVRPFTEALALHTERPLAGRQRQPHTVGGPVVSARHDTTPERYPSLPWHRRGDRTVLRAATPGRAHATTPDSFVPTTINDVINRWRSRRPKGVPRGHAGIVPVPTARALADVVLIGKEGDQLLERQRGITTLDAAVTVYLDTAEATWHHARAVLQRLGARAVAARFPTIPARTRRYLTAEAGRTPATEVRIMVIEALRLDAIRVLAHAGRGIPGDLDALLAAYAQLLDVQVDPTRRCQHCDAPLSARQRRWCSDACRQRARRQARQHDRSEGAG